jgi:hypothetical protein
MDERLRFVARLLEGEKMTQTKRFWRSVAANTGGQPQEANKTRM